MRGRWRHCGLRSSRLRRSKEGLRRHRALELRRNLEIEGYTNDIASMKQKLSIFQEYIEKLRALMG